MTRVDSIVVDVRRAQHWRSDPRCGPAFFDEVIDVDALRRQFAFDNGRFITRATQT